jgi:integrase
LSTSVICGTSEDWQRGRSSTIDDARERFLGWLPDSSGSLSELSAGWVIGYVMQWARRRESLRPDMVTLPALRSFLRFLHVAGHVPGLLVDAVPSGRAHPGRLGVPRAASGDGIRAVLASCDRDSAVGQRDYAIVLSLTRLALRGGEVARLELGDVGWRVGEVTIRGKGGRVDVLPLPGDVGEAWADYLLHARPKTSSTTLFVTMVAPFTGLATSSVTQVLARGCARAGVARFGPHRIRHAVACGLLDAGASLEEIGQCCGTPRSAPRRSTPRSTKSGWPSWSGHARREQPDDHPDPGRGLPGHAPIAGLHTPW